MVEKKIIDEKLLQAVADIKEAILQGQYEAWHMLDFKSSVVTDEKSASAIADLQVIELESIRNSSIAIGELQKINIYHILQRAID